MAWKNKSLTLLPSLFPTLGQDFKMKIGLGDSSNHGLSTTRRTFYYYATTFSEYKIGSQTQQCMNMIYGCPRKRYNCYLNALSPLPFSFQQGSLNTQLKWSCLIFIVTDKETKSIKPRTAGI